MKKKWKGWMAIALFIGTLCFFCFVSLLVPDREWSALEARKLTTHIGYTSVKQYFNRELFETIESYVSDQVVGRDLIAELYGDIQSLLGRRALGGRLKLENGHIVQVWQDNPNIRWYSKKIGKVNREFMDAGIPFLFVNTPVKASIVADGEKWNGKELSNRESKVKQYMKLLSKEQVSTLDLTENIKKLYEDGMDPFYKTDHHWNCDGVWEAGQILLKQMATQSLDIATPSREEYGLYEDVHPFYGSCLRGMGGTLLFCSRYEDIVKVWYPLSGEFEIERNRKETLSGDGTAFIDKKIYEGKEEKYFDYYTLHLGGNNKKIVIRNKSCHNGKKLLLAGDSFSLSMLPLLASAFEEIHYFDARALDISLPQYGKNICASQAVFIFNANLARDRYQGL